MGPRCIFADTTPLFALTHEPITYHCVIIMYREFINNVNGNACTCYKWVNVPVVMCLQRSDSGVVKRILLTLSEYRINKHLTGVQGISNRPTQV